ncbi:MAG: hypothetical protein E7272_12735 [Pseudobutyrivibrio ruminis]|uniref:DUF3137 domain-containing protein n=1 Tax=Pseudobutyrivibrio ruminis TaxID=46206 RepID=A0A927U9V3_9FIRM|nr:hypothetical protein [Pseudobutyrivibrio ruminis]
MNTKVYLKKKKDKFWGEHPHIMLGITALIGGVTMIALIFVIPIFLPTLYTCSWIALMTEYTLSNVRRHYYTGHMGFIIKDKTLYAIRLLNTSRPLGTEVEGPFVYAPAGSALQMAALPHNIAVANDNIAHEREVVERGKYEQSYITALNEIYNSLDLYPYETNPDETITIKIYKYYRQKMHNTKLRMQNTSGDSYMFLIMEEPEIIEVTKKKFVVRYKETTGEEGIATFTNCFDGLVEAIKEMKKGNER